MRKLFLTLAAAVASILAQPSTSQAGHHLWHFTHVFSNASGSVQFVELFTNENNEAGVGPFTVTVSGNTFSFGTNLPTQQTANTWILMATSGYASLPGAVTPDYVIPAGFFSTGGGRFNYASGADIWNYGAVPTDGRRALNRDGSTPVNVATNFAGQSGTVILASAVPTLPAAGVALLLGALLLLGSGLLRRRHASVA